MQATSPARRMSAPDAIGGDKISVDICVIGAGAGGMAVALQAAAFGRSVVLIEKNKMGGAHLSTACIPSKSLTAAAKRAEAFRTAGKFGIAPAEPEIDHRAVAAHLGQVVSSIQANHTVERMQAMGVRVILAAARFLDKATVLAGDYRISARRFVIATGSYAAVPPIPGLAALPYFTADTIFENTRKLDHLIIVGGGSVGMEMAQAFRRLGSQVTLIESSGILERMDTEFASLAARTLRAEGIGIREATMIEAAEGGQGLVRLKVRSERGQDVIEGTHILLATGRRPNISDLNLEIAGVKSDQRGIIVTRALKTTNSRVYAVGDVVAGSHPSTHAAAHHADVVLRRILFRLPAKVNDAIVPSVVFTDPEIAQVGLSERDAIRRNLPVRALRWPFYENDRARAERAREGQVKVLTDKKGHVLGAAIAGQNASELIQIWALAVKERMHIGKIAGTIAPYPTLGEASRKAALSFYSSVPGAPWVRKIMNFLAKFG